MLFELAYINMIKTSAIAKRIGIQYYYYYYYTRDKNVYKLNIFV